MKQIIIFLIIASFGFPHYAQVGINNTNPKASLDITATNQTNPSNIDGLLIPRIDTFPTTPPTAAQQGMLVYLTTTSGTNTSGYYYWDNGSSTWKAMLGTSDADFFETGGTPPNDINDNIYTHGKVNIGTSDFSSSTTLSINTSETIGAFIKNNNASSPNGLTLSLPADNASIKTGLSVNLSGINSNAFISSGIKTNFSTTGINNSFDGIQQNFNGNSTNGIIKGLNNNFTSSSSYRSIIGISNNIDSEGIGEHIGVSNSLGGIASGKQKGNETFIDNSGDGYHYGNYNILSGIGSGNKYGTYNLIETSANGTHYGVYSDVLSPTGYAGYFLGRVSIGTTTSNNYMLPSTRGSNGQVMRTDGTGNLSWVTPTQNDADWFGEGTTSAPNNINDNIFTNGFVGIGDSTPDNILDVEYTGNIDNGVSILYNNTDDSGPTVALKLTGENLAGATSNITGAYIQVKNSIGTDRTQAIYAFNTASGNTNTGLSATASGAGQNNFGTSATARGASQNNFAGFFRANSTIGKNYGVTGYAFGATTNWAGYFGDINTTPDVGSGNVYIQDLLQVDGALKFTSGANNNYILKSDASGNATWVDPTVIFTNTNTQNTLDQAYDEGGAGVGNTITADSGAVSIVGTDGFQVTGTFNSGVNLTLSGAGTRMFFYPKKAAFRTGYVDGNQWDIGNVGPHSFASGYNTIASSAQSTAMGRNTTASNTYSVAMGGFTTASGSSSTAMGAYTTASGNQSTAMGNQTIASGINSTAIGRNTTASGNFSTAMGVYTTAFSFGETTLGSYSTIYTPNSTSFWNASDRLFVLGNGVDTSNRSNALTVYKNGTVGIGTTAISPATLHIKRNDTGYSPQLIIEENEANDGARILFENSVETTNKWTLYARADNNSASNFFNIHNTISGDILTIKGDGRVGINDNNPTYALELPNNSTSSIGKARANAWVTYSDSRIKKEQQQIKYGLNDLLKIQAKSYIQFASEFKNDELVLTPNSGKEEIGFIAQELYNIIPEATYKPEDENKNLWSVNYEKIIPVTVQAIKELNAKIEVLETENQQLKQQLKKYEDIEARLSALENNAAIQVNN